MLHFIRERAQGWLAWFIVGLISIPFALWGINSYIGGPAEIAVATINDEPITQAELKQAMQQYRDRMRSVLGEEFDPELFDNAEVKANVLNGLIEQKLLLSSSYTLGQYISDATLSNIIQSTPAFQKNGVFDSEYYGLVLARVGFSPASYEAELRNDMLSQELMNNIQQTAVVTESGLNSILSLEKQSRDVAYGVVSAQDQLAEINIDEQLVKDYFDANRENYLAPERVVVDYIELSIDGLKAAVEIDEQALEQFYNDNKDQFVGPEQRRVSHILIEGDDEAALTAIESIKTRLDNGESFAELAGALSQDSGSAQNGGDLGFFQRGVMDAGFEKSAFALLNEGDISTPVKTEFGYHLIKLTATQSSEGKSFVEARDELVDLYRYQQAEQLFYEQAEQLADLSYENPESLDVAAEELAMEIKTAAAITRDGSGSGILASKKVVAAAFSEDVLGNDLNSAVIEVSKSHLVVVHKKQHIESSYLPYESMAPAIEESMRFEQASAKAAEQGESILSQLKSGSDASSLFTDNNWHQTESFKRNTEGVSAQILEQAFSVAKPTTSVAQYAGFTATNGNYIVIKVSAVQKGNIEDIAAEERDGLQENLSRVIGDSEFKAFIDSLKADANIEVFNQNLN